MHTRTSAYTGTSQFQGTLDWAAEGVSVANSSPLGQRFYIQGSDMAAYFCKLIPPRATFAQDMSETEAKIMEEHAAYWHDLLRKGWAITFGLVADPAGAYGIGVVEVDGDGAVRSLTANDPSILSGRGFEFEVHPMPFGAARL